MALTFSVLDSGYQIANQSTYNTQSDAGITHVTGDGLVTLVSGRLYYLVLAGDRTGGFLQATSVQQDPDGTPLSFSYIPSSLVLTPVGDGGHQVWKVVPGSTTADAQIRVVFSSSISDLIWVLIEVTGYDGTGTEVQRVNANGTASPGSVTMSSYGATDNAILSILSLAEFATGSTIVGEHTELADIDDTERTQLMVQVNNPHGSDTTPSGTYTGSFEWVMQGIEVKASGAAPTPPRLVMAARAAPERRP